MISLLWFFSTSLDFVIGPFTSDFICVYLRPSAVSPSFISSLDIRAPAGYVLRLNYAERIAQAH